MKIKRTISLLLVLTMLLSLSLLGCGGKDSNQGSKEPAVTTEPGGTTQPVVQEKKEISISIAMWDFVDFGLDPMGEKIQNDLKVKIESIPLSWDNDVEQITLFAASGDLPDIVAAYPLSSAQISRFYSWIDQGIIRDIPNEMIAKYPLLKEMCDSFAALQVSKDIFGGKTYFLPRPESVKDYYQASHNVIYYRKDWLNNVGISKAPETLDEFYQMLRAFTFDDPNKSGTRDTFGFTSAGLNQVFFSIWGVDNESWIEEDGKYIPGYLSKRNVDALKFMRKIYEEGLWDPEFASNGWRQAIQKLTTDLAGSLIRNGDLLWLRRTIIDNWGVAHPDVEDPLEYIGILPPLRKDNNSAATWAQFIGTSGSEISSKVNDEKLDRILELFEYILTPEIRTLIRFGFEGEDYDMDGNMLVRRIDPATGNPIAIPAKYPSMRIGSLTDWGWDEDIELPWSAFTPEIKELGQKIRDTFNPLALKTNLHARFISTPAKDNTVIQFRDTFIQIIMGRDDVERAFEAFSRDAMNMGMSKAIEEVNAALANVRR